MENPTWFSILKIDFDFGKYNLQCDAFYRTLNPAITDNHTHGYYEIHFVTSGCKKVTLNFTEEIYLKPGEFLLIGPEVFQERQGTVLCLSSGTVLIVANKLKGTRMIATA